MRLLVFSLLALGLAACSTQRTLRIVTDPPGADVWVNGEKQPGTSPVDYRFIHYQTFELRVEKVGYQTFARAVEIGNQTDGYPIIDLPSELSQKHRVFQRNVKLAPLPPSPDEAGVTAVMEQARQFRKRARREAAEGRQRFRPAGK